MSRYDTSADEFEPGSGGTVLRNLLGITSREEIEAAETEALYSAVEQSILHIETDQRFTVDFVRALHRSWLGGIYPFAGELRTVHVSKNGMLFCPAANLWQELARFDQELAKHTPCEGMSLDRLAQALAAVHVEFILIHPFREGNGRVGRWLATLMSVQAGFGVLDFTPEATDIGRGRYFAALRSGFAGRLETAEEWFAEVVRRTS